MLEVSTIVSIHFVTKITGQTQSCFPEYYFIILCQFISTNHICFAGFKYTTIQENTHCSIGISILKKFYLNFQFLHLVWLFSSNELDFVKLSAYG